MLKNYFKISVRSLLKTPLFTTLNVLGLAVGLAVSLLLFLHVRQELSFDQYHSQVNRIHRVIVNAFWDPAHPQTLTAAPNAVGPAMQEDIPEVAQQARVLHHNFGESAFVVAGEHKLVEPELFWADPAIFNIFDFKTVAGDLASALAQPNTVALSRSTAERYFGTDNPVGQALKIDQMPPVQVKAVFEDAPGNSTWAPNVIGSFSSIKWANDRLVWSNSSFETWVLLHPDASLSNVQQQLAALLDKNVPKEDQVFSLWLQPLRNVHLYSSEMRSDPSARLGDPKQVGILGALALAVLLIACFNYTNLSTARSQLRFREVGINKTMGASRSQLAGRFYAETAVLTGVSLVLALGLLRLGIPFFNQLADKNLSTASLTEPLTLATLLGIGVLVVLLAGSYPALFLSAFLPKNLLHTSFRKDTGAGWLRRTLVTAQFAASVVLIAGTLVFHQQMQFIQQKKLGFEPEQVVALTTVAAESQAQLDALMQGCQGLSSVQSVCRAQSYPGRSTSVRTLVHHEGDADGAELLTNRVTPGFEKVLGLQLLSGKTLPNKLPDDTVVNVVLTRKGVEYLGWTPESAIGQHVNADLGPNAVVCGVVEDFHASSLHKPLGAYAFHDAPYETRRFLLVKMQTANLPATMAQLETVFKSALPQSAFEYTFLDEHLSKLYNTERRTASVVSVFSLLSIVVSCLGLFGLAAFAAEQRTKEIGVRKVLGASVASIAGLLTRDFVKLVLVAFVLATPVAWWLLDQWLSDFAYHIELQWWVFALTGLLAVAVAVLTVGFQGVRAAISNPIKALRSE